MFGKRSFVRFAAIAALPVLVIALAGCGSSSGNNAAAPVPPTTPNGQPATVGVENTSLGNILVDAKGNTLYLFQKDTGTTSECTGSCATFWPPVTVTGKPIAGDGANATLLSTTKRSDGKTQVTYNGHPVYLYSGDHNPGDTTGQGINAFGGLWYASDATGTPVTTSAGSTGGGSGY